MKRFFEYFLAKWLFLVTVFLLYMPAFAYDMRQNTNDMAYHFSSRNDVFLLPYAKESLDQYQERNKYVHTIANNSPSNNRGSHSSYNRGSHSNWTLYRNYEGGWEEAGTIDRMITVFLKGGAAAFLIFLVILNKTRNWFLGIIGFIVLICTFFFFAPDMDI